MTDLTEKYYSVSTFYFQRYFPAEALLQQSIITGAMVGELKTARDSLNDIATQFRDGVEIKDRKYRFTTFRNCFVGKEAVDFIVRCGLASTRDEAVRLGRSIMKEIGSFEHVTRDHQFEGKDVTVRFPPSQGFILGNIIRNTFVIFSVQGRRIVFFAVDTCLLTPLFPHHHRRRHSFHDERYYSCR